MEVYSGLCRSSLVELFYRNSSCLLAANPIRHGLLMHTLAPVYILPKLYTYIHKSFSTHLSQNNNDNNNSQTTSRVEPKPRRADNFFAILGYFHALHAKRINARKNYKYLLTYHAYVKMLTKRIY